MPGAAVLAWLDFPLPAVGGITAVLIVVVVVIFRLITDRSAVKDQVANLTAQVDYLDKKLDRLEVRYDAERGLKHAAFNDVARAVLALHLVRNLATECSCGVLHPLSEIIDRVIDEMEIPNHPRLPPIGEL